MPLRFLTIFLLLFSLWLPPGRSEEHGSAILSDPNYLSLARKIRKRVGARVFTESPRQLCRYQTLLIIGPKQYLAVKDKKCPGQKRFVVNILYPELFQLKPENILVSPLPSAQSLRKYGKRWVIFYSPHLSYYVKHLKQDLKIKGFLLGDYHDLLQVLPRIPKNWPVLLLPDPVLLNPKVQDYLKLYFRRQRIHGLDLLGLNGLSWPQIRYSEDALLITILKALSSSRPETIYFCEVFP